MTVTGLQRVSSKAGGGVLTGWRDANSSTWPAFLVTLVSFFPAKILSYSIFFSIELNPSLTSHGRVLVFCQQSWKGQSQVATKWDSYPGSFAFSSQVQSSNGIPTWVPFKLNSRPKNIKNILRNWICLNSCLGLLSLYVQSLFIISWLGNDKFKLFILN